MTLSQCHHQRWYPLKNVTWVLGLITIVYAGLPFASPFGSHAGPVGVSAVPKASYNEELLSCSETPLVTGQHRSIAVFLGNSRTDRDDPSARRFSVQIKNIFQFWIQTSLRNTSRNWKDGEFNNTLTSKLLYLYAEPLLSLASTRPLEVEDAFTIPKEKLMDSLVPSLEQIYTQCKKNARAYSERYESFQVGDQQLKRFDLRRKLNYQMAQSKALTLARAIFIHKKHAIVMTGVLRLLNTCIQAFPALFVARLLRLIETGHASHPSKPLITALSLVVLLSVKMIVENMYFHNVVKCATEIRGALTGMIFDKSLKVSTGSSGLSFIQSGDKISERNGTISTRSLVNTGKDASVLGTGGVMNLVQTDATVIETAVLQVHTIWDGLLQISIYATLLFKYLGPSVIWGIAVLLLTIPTNSFMLRILNRMNKFELQSKDARNKKTSEAIQNIKLIKLFGWEQCFENDVQSYRMDELRRHLLKGKYRALNSAMSNAIPAIVLVVTLAAYRKTGHVLVASTIFTAISLFNQLRFPLLFYPMLIDAIANGKNSLDRICTYLSQNELTPYVSHLPKQNDEGGSISMTNGNFAWSRVSDDSSTNAPTTLALCNANITVNPGELVAVVGPVGSGKTALIKALLGELTPVPNYIGDHSLASDSLNPEFRVNSTSVICTGSVAYCAQEPWLRKGSIRDAILFGRPYNQRRYLNALCAAGLDGDIVAVRDKRVLSRGLLTHDSDVGEGGLSLSGGQRARVQLARALYGDDVGVYLLDDPLSALDASVGTMVFERLTRIIKKTRAAAVIVTNDISIQRRCDRVVLMGKMQSISSQNYCKIIDVGSYDELVARGHEIQRLAPYHLRGANQTDAIIEEEPPVKFDENSWASIDSECLVPMALDYDPEFISEHQIHRTFVDADAESDPDSTLPVSPPRTSVTRKIITVDDGMTTSAVPLSTYVDYLASVRNPSIIIATVLSFVISNGAQFFQQYVIAEWTKLGRGSLAQAMGGKYLVSLMYAAGVSSIALWLRSFLLILLGSRASEYFHKVLLASVFRAPVSFFDTTPSGQLLSRFGKEMDVIDRSVPDGLGSVLFCFFQIFMSVTALIGVVTPMMLAPLLLIGLLYVQTMIRFRPAARDLKRCESRSRSPVYTHLGEALRGSEVIRSFPSAVSIWSGRNRMLVDQNLSVFYSIKALDRWLSVRLETLGNVVVLSAAVAAVFLTRSGRLLPGTAGWGLTQALSITGLLTWAVRVLTDLESQMMSVVRVSELIGSEASSAHGSLPSHEHYHAIPSENKLPGSAYEALVKSLPQSAVFQSPAQRLTYSPFSDKALLDSGWPWNGGVEFKNVSMRYNSISSLVLKNVTLSIVSGSTIGIVGRTGSGKSSLLQTLFRLTEIEAGGGIEIDHIDVRSVHLQTLREVLSIIPQDPVLFAGTLLYNLDATGKVSREDAWKALEAASPAVALEARSSGHGLDWQISEGGKNMSAGQRQLICLARALIRRNKILILDEATSSVDQKTDSLVQETIRREFVEKGVTVITVAHRLDTVLGYDKIAVLGDGRVLEFGSPDDLLNQPDGELRKLVDVYERSKKRGSELKSVVAFGGVAAVR